MTAVPPIYVQAGFLDAKACRRVRDAMDRGSAEPGAILGERTSLEPDVRRVSDVDVDASTLADVEARLETQRAALATFYGCRLGEREGVSFLRYRSGDFYLRHRDRGIVDGWPDAARRLISVVVFLNSARARHGGSDVGGDFGGGELRLFEASRAPLDVVPEEGCLVAFSALVAHEVLPVTSGTRDTLVDWFYEE